MTVFISFYTLEYRKRAARLRASLENHGLRFSIRRRDYSGSFVDITNRKAEFIMEMREEFKGERLVWMDSDLVVYQYPTLLVQGNPDLWDVAYTTRQTKDRGNSYVSGLVGVGTGPMVVHFLNAWKRNAVRFTNGPRWMVDDETFKRAVRRTGGLTRFELPPSYWQHPKYAPDRENVIIGQPAA